MKNCFLIFCIFFLMTRPLFSFVEDIENTLKVDNFNDPIIQDDKVQNFSVKVKHNETFYSTMPDKPYYESNMVAAVEVFDAKDLKDYAIVQYIRGCHFYSYKENDQVKYYLGTARHFFGTSVTFKHPQWVLDSLDLDPIYWSATEATSNSAYDRTDLYLLDNPHERFGHADLRTFYGNHTTERQYYVQDRPSGSRFAGVALGYANTSLEFRTCLFRTEDVPKISDPEGVAITKAPLKCFYWQSNFKFDYQLMKYEMQDRIDPFCLEQD